MHLPGFEISLSDQHCLYLFRMLKLQGEQFLKYCSTSPDYEGPNFTADIQAAYRYLLEGQNNADPEAVTYEWSQAAGWAKVKQLASVGLGVM
jgi:hypothetical protein